MPKVSGVAHATVSVQGVWLLAAGARAGGLDVPALLSQHGLEAALGADIDARVSAPAVLALWAALPALTGIAHFGVWLAELACAEKQTSLGAHLVMSARTLGAGLERLVAFERVFHGVQATSLERDTEGARITHRPPAGIGPGADQAIEFAFAWILGTARHTTGVALVPVRVRFRCRAPADPAPYTRFFGREPEFGSAENTLELEPAALELPQRTADELVARLTERHARRLALELPTEATTAGKLRGFLAKRVATGAADTATLAAAAREFGIPERTLQRRLAGDGTSFAVLLDEVRHRLALEHLADPATSIAEVAFALGFGDQAAFHRAFVRWTGHPPGEHKRRLQLASEAKPN